MSFFVGRILLQRKHFSPAKRKRQRAIKKRDVETWNGLLNQTGKNI